GAAQPRFQPHRNRQSPRHQPPRAALQTATVPRARLRGGCGKVERNKNQQAPSSRETPNPNSQVLALDGSRASFWRLEFGVCLGLGVWCLGFDGACPGLELGTYPDLLSPM